jgi:hypothetical protein
MGFRRWYNAQKAGVQIAVVGGIVVMMGGSQAQDRPRLPRSGVRSAHRPSAALDSRGDPRRGARRVTA